MLFPDLLLSDGIKLGSGRGCSHTGVCQGKVEPGFPEKANENKRIESRSGSISRYTTLVFFGFRLPLLPLPPPSRRWREEPKLLAAHSF